VQIAKRCASKHHVRWSNYFRIEVDFEGPNLNDYSWGVYFFRKPVRDPNKGFFVRVDDRTREVSSYWFAQLPTE
jgi:hypothetical protein